MITITTKRTTTVATILAIAATAIAISLAAPSSASAAPSEHDPERCVAYQMLAQCDQGDCDTRCGDPAASTCSARCEQRYERAIEKTNRKFACGIDICDPEFLEVEVEFFDNKMKQCKEKKCEDKGMSQSCYDNCTDTRNDKVDKLCERAAIDRGCSAEVVEAVCASVDYEEVVE